MDTQTTVSKISEYSLSEFTGSDSFFKHWLGKNYIMTQGVHYLTENGAAWLIDAIFSHQVTNKVRSCSFQVWTLEVTDSSALLTCKGDEDDLIVEQKINFTDFPLEKITLWCVPNELNGLTLLLPSEY